MMPRLAIYDDVRTAADVRACAFAVFERRRAAYIKLAAEVPKELMESEQPAESERPSGPTWEAICKEVARQTGIPGGQLKLGSEGRGQPHVAFKQLAMALTCKLTRLSLKTTARLFGLNNHTTSCTRRRRWRRSSTPPDSPRSTPCRSGYRKRCHYSLSRSASSAPITADTARLCAKRTGNSRAKRTTNWRRNRHSSKAAPTKSSPNLENGLFWFVVVLIFPPEWGCRPPLPRPQSPVRA
jgi:hypothetical protein